MVNTRSSASTHDPDNAQNPDPIAQQLSAIASKLNTIDLLAAEVAALKAQSSYSHQVEAGNKDRDKGKEPHYEDEDVDMPWWMKNPSRRPHTKMEFPKFEGGDPRG